MIIKKALCASLLVSFLLTNFNTPAQQLEGTVWQLETIEKFSFSGHRERRNYVITSRKDWESLWNVVHLGRVPQPALPEIDFGNKIIIAVFDGEQGDSRNTFAITQLVKTGKILHVFTKRIVGSSLCPPGPPITVQPYHIIVTDQIKKAKKRVIFESTEQETMTCP